MRAIQTGWRILQWLSGEGQMGLPAVRVGRRNLFKLVVVAASGATCSRHDAPPAAPQSITARAVDRPVVAPVRDPWQLQSTGVMQVRTEVEGDPAVGTVVIFRQVHLPIGIDDPNVVRANLPLIVESGRYHAEMLKLMERLRPKHVFVENEQQTYSPEQVNSDAGFVHGYALTDRRELQQTFGGAALLMTDVEYASLVVARASLVYALRHTDVWLHRTLAPAEAHLGDDCEHALQTHLKETAREDSTNDRGDPVTFVHMTYDPDNPAVRAVCDQREPIAVREVMTVLHQRPGEKVVMLYGGWHQFADDFGKLPKPPRVLSVWWNLPDAPHLPKNNP